MKRLTLTILALMALLPLWADELTTSLTSVSGGWKLSVSLDNSSTSYRAFQLDVVLPSGVTFTDDDATAGSRLSGFTLQALNHPNGYVRVTAHSVSNANIGGASGVLFTLHLTGTGTHMVDDFKLHNCLFTTTDDAEVTLYLTGSSEIDEGQAERNELFAALLVSADSAYNANQVWVKGDGLITSVDQLSSPYTESSEGSLDALLDGDASTFWHSTWTGGDVDAGIHYLEIALPDGTMGEIELDLTRRPVTNDHLTKADIVGVDAEGNTFVVATIDLPYVSNTETVTATFILDQVYSAIRIVEQATTSNRGYWHASEIQLYNIVLADDCFNVVNRTVADELCAAIATAKTVGDATQEDIDALQQAIDTYEAAVVAYEAEQEAERQRLLAITSTRTTSQNVFYDLMGRRTHIHRGIIIHNGKKIVK